MAAIGAGLFIVAMFALTIGCLILVGAFSGKPAYDGKKRKKLREMIHQEQMLARAINAELDALPRSANLPLVGTRWHLRRDLKKMELDL